MSTKGSVLDGFTGEQIESLRDAILKRDSDNAKNSFIDLSKDIPNPKLHARQQFPKLVYDHAKSKPARDYVRPRNVNGVVIQEPVHDEVKYATRTVNSQEELETALKQGFSEEIPLWNEDGKLVKAAKREG